MHNSEVYKVYLANVLLGKIKHASVPASLADNNITPVNS